MTTTLETTANNAQSIPRQRIEGGEVSAEACYTLVYAQRQHRHFQTDIRPSLNTPALICVLSEGDGNERKSH